jgi:hypothetical protein
MWKQAFRRMQVIKNIVVSGHARVAHAVPPYPVAMGAACWVIW